MSRRKDVFNSPEYRHIEENLDDILKELEGDEETRNMTMPEEWDKDFREILEKVNEENRQRHRKKLRRTIAAAAAVLIVSVPVIGFVGMETVEGDGIMELFENVVNFNGRQYSSIGTDDYVSVKEENNEIIFNANGLEELNEQISEEFRRPFFRIMWIPDGFFLQEAIYNEEFDALNIEFGSGENSIFVSQQTITESGVKNNVSKDELIATVRNESVDQSVNIYEDVAEHGLYFQMVCGNVRLDCYTEVTLEKCKKLVASICFE